MQLLRGDGDEKLIVQWNRELTRIQALIDDGNAMDAVVALRTVIPGIEEIEGPGATVAASHAYGKLGIAHFHLRRREEAEEFTNKALKLYENSGDENGIHAYRTNLQHIRANCQSSYTD